VSRIVWGVATFAARGVLRRRQQTRFFVVPQGSSRHAHSGRRVADPDAGLRTVPGSGGRLGFLQWRGDGHLSRPTPPLGLLEVGTVL
jgi:hypothetical protein